MAELNISKKTIGKLFSEMQNKKFIIPDFQRPYRWDTVKCETLWDDIIDFAQTDAKKGDDINYFLGTIVYYFDENKNREIIDGQQRITSFLLMLRAFYKKLEDMEEDKKVAKLKDSIASCIWDVDPLSGEIPDKTKIRIESLVATEKDNDVFHKILETGTTVEDASDFYSKNFNYFKQRCDKYATANPMNWEDLCLVILNGCIILPVECDTQDVALTIFSTLNDRGLQLDDSDIFKAQIYRNNSTEEKRKEFTKQWKELTDCCEQGNFSINDVFRYYTHVLRARIEDKSPEKGLRKFYADKKYEKLKNENLMSEIMALAEFWRYINREIIPDEEVDYSISVEARKYLHCLSHYPNDFWKYPTSVFFLKNKNSQTFDADFVRMLQKLIAYLFAKFIETPGINAIKDEIYAACISLDNSSKLQVRITLDEDLLKRKIDDVSPRFSRVLLLLYAYLHPNQKEKIIEPFDIEHIFPKKWQDTNYNGWSKEDADAYLDRFGNKIVIEKKLNIQAGNGYFGVKKQRYKYSGIAEVLELSNYYKDDWTKDDIEEREGKFKETIIDFFKKNLLNV